MNRILGFKVGLSIVKTGSACRKLSNDVAIRIFLSENSPDTRTSSYLNQVNLQLPLIGLFYEVALFTLLYLIYI